MKNLQESLLELIKTTSTKLPVDVINVIKKHAEKEKNETPARYAMDIILKNIKLAEDKSQPICQDTGSILFFVKATKGFDEGEFITAAKKAVITATEKGYLRQNSVDPLTGKNSGNNLGPGSPYFHFEQLAHSPSPQPSPSLDFTRDKQGERGIAAEVKLILKGGGCENMGIQYSLPNAKLGAQRNADGVKKCILDSVLQAQGKGCAPGILGVTIGGDRATSYAHSKEQLLRKLDDKNPDPQLAEMETEMIEKANSLGIGPMGFGGETTILGCKIGLLNRLPASFFVTVSYMCWAFRRQGIVLNNDGSISKWLY